MCPLHGTPTLTVTLTLLVVTPTSQKKQCCVAVSCHCASGQQGQLVAKALTHDVRCTFKSCRTTCTFPVSLSCAIRLCLTSIPPAASAPCIAAVARRTFLNRLCLSSLFLTYIQPTSSKILISLHILQKKKKHRREASNSSCHPELNENAADETSMEDFATVAAFSSQTNSADGSLR